MTDVDKTGQAWRQFVPLALVAVLLIASVAAVWRVLRNDPMAPPRVVKIATGSWKPFVDPSDLNGGPVTEMVAAALRKAGLAPVFDYGIWDDVPTRVERDQVFAGFPLIETAARAEYRFSVPIVKFRYVTFVRASTRSEVAAGRDLTSLTWGRINGYGYSQGVSEIMDSASRVREFASGPDAMRALVEGEVDAVSESESAGSAALAELDDVDTFSVVTLPVSHATQNCLTPGASAGVRAATDSCEGLRLMYSASADQKAIDAIDGALTSLAVSSEFGVARAATENPPVDYGTLDSPDGGAVSVVDGDGRASPTPSGTPILVTNWRSEMIAGRELFRVKILGGPLRGALRFTELASIRLGEGS
ncbi:MAG: transporter substrate-binding domain-containing protein [Gordonia sp. (in: high G+C Gram-positive bacteria)]|uniref:substrate-binding periplasmic protein n=1 Tax=Gordonia sp. (in: high G+C Gram-positive bacteria) TaxID=84139 RepID=UPI003BB78A4B